MMKRPGAIVIALVVYLMLSSAMALADEIHLRNGDRISGKIIRMEDGKLVVKTNYAGEITISWQEVVSLSVEEKIKVVLEDGTALEGQTLTFEAGKMKVNTEKLEESSVFNLVDVKTINPKDVPRVRITFGANAGLSLERGNSDTDEYELNLRFQARTKKSRYTLGGEFNKEKTEGKLTTKDWTAFANYDYFFTKKWFGYVHTKFEHDEFADLDLRSTLGAGMGYQVFEGETLNLSFQAGPAYVQENYIETGDDNFTVARWMANYDQYFFSKLFQLFHLSDGYTSLENSDDRIVTTRQGIRIPLYKGITATFQYSYDYDNEPSPDAAADYDSELSFLLGYEFKN
jgi:putative salt-induced outer membrane protein YdiY